MKARVLGLLVLLVVMVSVSGSEKRVGAFYDPPCDEEGYPIILIPGMMSTANWSCMLWDGGCDSGWHWMPSNVPPNAKSIGYELFLDWLRDSGFDVSNKFRIVYYDWRKPLAENVGRLKSVIDELKRLNGVGLVNLVGHSMGGLIGRAYIQGGNYGNDVCELVTVGTPHYGAAKAYPYWEGANYYRMDWYWQVAMGTLLEYWRLADRSLSTVEVLRSKVPSLKDILPTHDYLYRNADGNVIPENTMYERNSYLAQLNLDLGTLFNRVDGEVFTIVGDNWSTPKKFFVFEGSGGLYWPDGEPNWSREGEFMEAGDETVWVDSAKLPAPARVTQIHNQKPHASLLNDPFPVLLVLDSFGLTMPIPYQVATEEEARPSQLLFLFSGPADVVVTDADGKSVGPGNSEIEGAIYLVDPQGQIKFILIPTPLEGRFIIELEGGGEGKYVLELFDTFGEIPDVIDTSGEWVKSSSQIETGKTVNYSLTFDAEAEEIDLMAETPVIEIPVWAGSILVSGRAQPAASLEIRDAATDEILGREEVLTDGHFIVQLYSRLSFGQEIYPVADGVRGLKIKVEALGVFLPMTIK